MKASVHTQYAPLIGILTPFSASWGGIEGMIFFNFPLWDHIAGWPEVFSQTFLFSVILTYHELSTQS